MANSSIEQIVEQIRHALYGKDVRENIALGIETCYEDANDAVLKSDIVDALNSTATDKVLSAKQGKVLNEIINNNNDKIITSLNNFGYLDIFPYLNTITGNISFNGITASPNTDGSFTLNGTATQLWNLVFFNVDMNNGYIKKGDTIVFRFTGTDRNNKIPLQIFYKPTGEELTYVKGGFCGTDLTYTVPDNCDNLYVRLSISSGITVNNEKVKVNITNNHTSTFGISTEWIPNNMDFNAIKNAGCSFFASSRSYYNNAFENGSEGLLIVYPQGDVITYQVAYNVLTGMMALRRFYNNAWSSWSILKSGKDVVSAQGLIPNNTDLNDVSSNGIYLFSDGYTYMHHPISSTGNAGMMLVFNSGTVFVQIYIPWTADTLYMRRKHMQQPTFSDWHQINGGGSVENDYTFNEYFNTVTNNVSPSITTDTHNYLESTGDDTDVTAAIEALLETGVCHLGPGVFYVSGIDMPNESVLYGCGEKTIIRLLSSAGTSAYAIKMNWYNIVHGLKIDGQNNTSATVGDRHGILWHGNYTQEYNNNPSTAGYSQNDPRQSRIYNVKISNFSGGGITCYDTGYNLFNNLIVSDCLIENCSAGINISYWSEFHKFTNVQCYLCQYGCINNGGNNMFVNCDFSSSKIIGFLIDNENDQSTNNTHGSAIGCLFHHVGNNTGIGIKIINTHNGFIFDGCQMFYSKLQLIDTKGIVFSNCNFGQSNCDIIITNGGVTLFSNNMYQGTPTINITNNSHVHFTNCYVRDTGAIVSA